MSELPDAPQAISVCPTCDGRGYIQIGITVYEHGCGVPHADVDERPCENCGGQGELYDDAEGYPIRVGRKEGCGE